MESKTIHLLNGREPFCKEIEAPIPPAPYQEPCTGSLQKASCIPCLEELARVVKAKLQYWKSYKAAKEKANG